MSSKNILSLDSATVPLAGTEVIPIWDGTATVKVTIANLTADRVVDVLSLTAAGTVVNSYSTVGDASYYRIVNTDTGASSFSAYQMKTGFSSHIWQTFCRNDRLYIGVAGVADYIYIDSSANFNNIAGNYVPLTANKGINFTANPHAAGMTSQLLNWYEEGTWTPNQGAGLTVAGTFSSTGTYVRIGRLVSLRGTLSATTSISCTAASAICSNLPFTSATDTAGVYFNAELSGGGQVDASTVTVYSAGPIAATAGVYIQINYQV